MTKRFTETVNGVKYYYFQFVSMRPDAPKQTSLHSSMGWMGITNATHASTHATGGSDPITPESIGAAKVELVMFTQTGADMKFNADKTIAQIESAASGGSIVVGYLDGFGTYLTFSGVRPGTNGTFYSAFFDGIYTDTAEYRLMVELEFIDGKLKDYEQATLTMVNVVPTPTSSDEGKVLKVVNGVPAWVSA